MTVTNNNNYYFGIIIQGVSNKCINNINGCILFNKILTLTLYELNTYTIKKKCVFLFIHL